MFHRPHRRVCAALEAVASGFLSISGQRDYTKKTMRRGRPVQEFRAHWLIRIVALAALLIWLAALGVAAIFALPLYTYVSIAFFIVYFCMFVVYYWKIAYVVDEHGVTVRGPTDRNHYAWEDIENVRSSEIPLGGYYVSTKKGGFVLSSFVEGRERLLDVIITRAGLFPLTGN